MKLEWYKEYEFETAFYHESLATASLAENRQYHWRDIGLTNKTWDSVARQKMQWVSTNNNPIPQFPSIPY